MATDHALPANEHEVPAVDTEHRYAHPTDKLFVQTAVILAVVTAIEVAWSYLPWGDSRLALFAEIGGLVIMMAFKFYVVASIFMHLKFDSKLLTGVFYFGLALAVAVYVVTLLTFEFFSSATPPYT
jgi:cytochrome c oxidase subunit 4